jgi:hypothetical protein
MNSVLKEEFLEMELEQKNQECEDALDRHKREMA